MGWNVFSHGTGNHCGDNNMNSKCYYGLYCLQSWDSFRELFENHKYWAYKNRACGHMICLLVQTAITHKFLCHFAMTMEFSALNQQLIGFMMKFTECKYSVPVLRYDLYVMGCSLCPHALFSQTWSQMC